MDLHPVAKLFPPMSEAEFERLKEDIRKNGQAEAIVKIGEQIIDGRNRWNAIRWLQDDGAEIEPVFRDWEGECGSPVAYAWAKNGVRRQLDKSQLAAIAVEMLPMLEAEAKERMERGTANPSGDCHQGRATEKAGEIVGVSGSLVARAKRAKDENPEAFEEIREGKKTVNAALAGERPAHARPVVKVKARDFCPGCGNSDFRVVCNGCGEVLEKN